jgi:hypothetical protein
MRNSEIIRSLLAVSAGALLLSSTGCNNLPGTSKQQGAVIGGAGGAVAGAAVGGEHHRLLGALLGGALGAGGGYVVGANSDKISGSDTAGAKQANDAAQAQPATPEQARLATTADLNRDGFVTLDEVVAMRKAGLSDQEMIDRLRSTGQIFELTPEQQQFLLNQGVSQSVVTQMQNLNRDRYRLSPTNNGVISQPVR